MLIAPELYMAITELLLLKCRELPPGFMMSNLEQGLYFYPGLIQNTPHGGLSLKKKNAVEKSIHLFSVASTLPAHTPNPLAPTPLAERKAVVQRNNGFFSMYIHIYIYSMYAPKNT